MNNPSQRAGDCSRGDGSSASIGYCSRERERERVDAMHMAITAMAQRTVSVASFKEL